MLFQKKKKKKSTAAWKPLNTALKDCYPEVSVQRKLGGAFIKFELRGSGVASLAKKPVMLTVMLINITQVFYFPDPPNQLLFLAHVCLHKARSSSSTSSIKTKLPQMLKAASL